MATSAPPAKTPTDQDFSTTTSNPVSTSFSTLVSSGLSLDSRAGAREFVQSSRTVGRRLEGKEAAEREEEGGRAERGVGMESIIPLLLLLYLPTTFFSSPTDISSLARSRAIR